MDTESGGLKSGCQVLFFGKTIFNPLVPCPQPFTLSYRLQLCLPCVWTAAAQSARWMRRRGTRTVGVEQAKQVNSELSGVRYVDGLFVRSKLPNKRWTWSFGHHT